MDYKTIFNKLIFSDESFYNGIALLIFRIGISFSMIYLHGYSKLINFAEKSANFPDPLGIGNSLSLGLALFAEVFCSLLIIFGLFTRFASFPLLITMIVATWMVNGHKEFIFQEKGFIYLLSYILLLLLGSGKYSIDYLIQKRKTK